MLSTATNDMSLTARVLPLIALATLVVSAPLSGIGGPLGVTPAHGLLICARIDASGTAPKEGATLKLRTTCKTKRNGTPSEIAIGSTDDLPRFSSIECPAAYFMTGFGANGGLLCSLLDADVCETECVAPCHVVYSQEQAQCAVARGSQQSACGGNQTCINNAEATYQTCLTNAADAHQACLASAGVATCLSECPADQIEVGP